MRIHFLVNKNRLDAVKAAIEAIHIAKGKGVEVATNREAEEVLGIPSLEPESLGIADLMITFGGDGTLIHAAELCAPHKTPILGVYYGRFGFVTQCQPHEIGASLSQFFDGEIKTEERMMLEVRLLRSGSNVLTLHCLNEAALLRSMYAPMMTFGVAVDGLHLTSYPADGVIVASPTGSTAYNLSAGGPIVDPRVQAFLLTALAPHTISARPLILHPDSTISLNVQTEGESVLSVDGKHHVHVLSGDEIQVSRSPYTTTLMVVDKMDFHKKLSERLSWATSSHNNREPRI